MHRRNDGCVKRTHVSCTNGFKNSCERCLKKDKENFLDEKSAQK